MPAATQSLSGAPGRRDVARRERRRRRHAVIDRRDEHRVQHPADRRRRQLAHQQQVDRLGERQPAHHLVERVAAHEDLVRLDVGERRLPASLDRGRLRASVLAASRWRVRASLGSVNACSITGASRSDRAVQPIAEIAEAGNDVFVRRSACDRRPACRSRRRDGAARRARSPSGAATMQIDADVAARRRCCSRSSAATALPPVASIGSIIST